MEVEMEISESRNLKAKLEMRERERQGRRQGGTPGTFSRGPQPREAYGAHREGNCFLSFKEKVENFWTGTMI